MLHEVLGTYFLIGASLADWLLLPVTLVVYALGAAVAAQFLAMPTALFYAAPAIAAMILAECRWPWLGRRIAWLFAGMIYAGAVERAWPVTFLSELQPDFLEIVLSGGIGALVARWAWHKMR